MTELSDLQLASALCEQVYRRDNLYQKLAYSAASQERFGSDVTIQDTYIPGFSRSNGFYYKNVTGFVGQVVQANGKFFVVFREARVRFYRRKLAMLTSLTFKKISPAATTLRQRGPRYFGCGLEHDPVRTGSTARLGEPLTSHEYGY